MFQQKVSSGLSNTYKHYSLRIPKRNTSISPKQAYTSDNMTPKKSVNRSSTTFPQPFLSPS